jgi:nitrile hydratase accessory protein
MAGDPRSSVDARAALQAIPDVAQNPTFSAPWEAQAFAIVVALHRRGVFGWSEWAAALGAQIKKAQAAGDPDSGTTYYRHWLAALEQLVQQRGLASGEQLSQYGTAWDRAAQRTPHGRAITLLPEDFG